MLDQMHLVLQQQHLNVAQFSVSGNRQRQLDDLLHFASRPVDRHEFQQLRLGSRYLVANADMPALTSAMPRAALSPAVLAVDANSLILCMVVGPH